MTRRLCFREGRRRSEMLFTRLRCGACANGSPISLQGSYEVAVAELMDRHGKHFTPHPLGGRAREVEDLLRRFFCDLDQHVRRHEEYVGVGKGPGEAAARRGTESGQEVLRRGWRLPQEARDRLGIERATRLRVALPLFRRSPAP